MKQRISDCGNHLLPTNGNKSSEVDRPRGSFTAIFVGFTCESGSCCRPATRTHRNSGVRRRDAGNRYWDTHWQKIVEPKGTYPEKYSQIIPNRGHPVFKESVHHTGEEHHRKRNSTMIRISSAPHVNNLACDHLL